MNHLVAHQGVEPVVLGIGCIRLGSRGFPCLNYFVDGDGFFIQHAKEHVLLVKFRNQTQELVPPVLVVSTLVSSKSQSCQHWTGVTTGQDSQEELLGKALTRST